MDQAVRTNTTPSDSVPDVDRGHTRRLVLSAETVARLDLDDAALRGVSATGDHCSTSPCSAEDCG